MVVSQIALSQENPTCSRFVLGVWRMAQWGLSCTEILDFIQACLNLGITTFDHADIYGDYTCEQLFGDALAKKPSLRSQMQLVTKCGIKLVSKNRPAHPAKIVPVIGTGKIDTIKRVIASEAWELSQEQWFAIWSASTGEEVP